MDKTKNLIFQENQQKGTRDWILANPASNREIEGYASSTSINRAESIRFYVNTSSSEYSLTVFRMGWYSGLGARQIIKPIFLKGFVQEVPLPDSETGHVECNWIESYIQKTDENWTSGVYVVKLEEQNTYKQSYIIFVVRNDTDTSDILFPLPMTTYQAYNFWGGKCLYNFGSGSNSEWGKVTGIKATKVSFNRPYAGSNNPKAAYGVGAGDFFTNVRPVTTHNYKASSAGWDYNMVRWLEKHGYNISYCTSVDIHAKPEIFKNSKIYLSCGHDEYWSYEMRWNVQKARDNGTNLAFFSSNTMYWQIRFEKSLNTKEDNRTIVCYKSRETDPVKDKYCTINFCDIPEQKSQATLIGVQYFIDPVAGDIKIANPNHWVFENTNLKKGDRLKGLLGYEIDGVVKESPDNVVVLANSPCQVVNNTSNLFVAKYILNKTFNTIKSILVNKFRIEKKHGKTATILFIIIALILLLKTISIFSAIVFDSILFLVLGSFFAWFLKIRLDKVHSNMTIYEAESGAEVFATGSMQWVWGLDDFNATMLRKSRISNKVDIITKNVLKRFGADYKSPDDKM